MYIVTCQLPNISTTISPNPNPNGKFDRSFMTFHFVYFTYLQKCHRKCVYPLMNHLFESYITQL